MAKAQTTNQDPFEQFEKMDDKDLASITADYLELAVNTKYNFKFMGMTTFTSERQGEVEAVILEDANGARFISGVTVLVNNLKKVTEMPCFVRILTKGKVKTKNGEYLDMDIMTLPISQEK
jgi:hypothetical protein